MARATPLETDPIRLDFRKLRQRRRLLDMSQTTLAAHAGVHRNVVSHWERGRRIPSTLELARAARALGTPLWDLFDVVDPEGNPVPWRGARR